MKLSTWAKIQGVHYRTAWQWSRTATCKTQTVTVIVEEAADNRVVVKVAAYARVSSSDQKADLERQLDRIMQFGNACGHQIKVAFTEVGSGLNGRRPKLLQLLGDATIDLMIVEHRDRLVRFGFEYIEAALKAQGRIWIKRRSHIRHA